MIRAWERTGRRKVGDFRIFTMREDRARSPRTGEEHAFYVMECVDWVNVIALTPEGDLILVEQYRHGSETIELEVPGGMMDAQDASPEIAGARELREETGYEGDSAEVIGRVFANPAIQTNTCHTVLIRNCRLRHPVLLDHGEDLVPRRVPSAEIPSLVASGRFQHSLVVVALYHFDLWQRGLKPAGDSRGQVPVPESRRD